MSTWICPACNEELGELNAYCLYCKHLRDTTIFNPDKYFIRDIRIYHIEKIMDYQSMSEAEAMESIDNNVNMTPQEKLFAKLFYHETMLVKDMDILTLRAHREELSKIAFEARARLSAATAAEDNKKKNGKPRGFERSINVDETSTNAINVIKERQKKLTGKEKIAAGLAAMYEKGGMSKAEAEAEANKAMGAGAILARLKDQKSKDIITGKSSTADVQSDVQSERIENKPFFNPFEKKNQ